MPRPARKPLTPEELKQLETLSGLGLNLMQMAGAMGMAKRTLERRMRETRGGRGAVKKGRGIALANVARTAYQLAVSGDCPAMTMFYLKTRAGWREKDRQGDMMQKFEPLIINMPLAGTQTIVTNGGPSVQPLPNAEPQSVPPLRVLQPEEKQGRVDGGGMPQVSAADSNDS